jgi:hypothetical protein
VIIPNRRARRDRREASRAASSASARVAWVPIACALAAAIAGAIVAWRYHRLGLTLTHYDARGHLVVARRIFDSLTPGWQQIGAVWLPLPHLLNAIPVQVDLFYRSGASAVALSIAASAIATGAVAAIVSAMTQSSAASLAAAAVFALNPNVLYLQSTPMTEPLLIALTTLGIAMLIAWCRTPGPTQGSAPTTMSTGLVLALACLTRYEAWPVTACALTVAVFARWRYGESFATALRDIAGIARYPAIAIAGFAIFSRVVIGDWFLSRDFFVPENKALNDPMMAAAEIWWGVRTMSGSLLAVIGTVGVVGVIGIGLFDRRRADALIAASLVATAAIPWVAFFKGHPFRIRYMVPLIAIEAIGAGVLAGLIKRAAVPASLFLLAIAAYELRPLDLAAPMVVEAQWDRPNEPVRAQVTGCLGQPGSGQKVMASMGSLGHYMQEASHAGFAIRDFLHEGNGDLWLAALEHPFPYAEWILIEEKAEGGDMLARRAREQPGFLDGYSRVCEGAGLALYVRSGSSPRTDK